MMRFFETPLLIWTEQGLYCEAGKFYIDPAPRRERSHLPPLDLAIVTHAHSDHARRGCQQYICETSGLGLLKARLGKKISAQGFRYGEKFKLGEVTVSLHSAGHILGSAQVRIERGDEVWVASGDYKREPDPSCEPFEVIKCDTFVTEATFGTPQYRWPKGNQFGQEIAEWWRVNAEKGLNSILFGYSLGKAQRILAELAAHAPRPVLIYQTIAELTECYREQGRTLAATRDLNAAVKALVQNESLQGELILAPPSVLDESWAQALGEYKTAFASGWMQKGSAWSSYDHGFVMSDHADWNDLNQTIEETGAKRVFIEHRNGALVRHLRKKGLEAHPVETLSLENFARLGGRNLELFGDEQ